MEVVDANAAPARRLTGRKSFGTAYSGTNGHTANGSGTNLSGLALSSMYTTVLKLSAENVSDPRYGLELGRMRAWSYRAGWRAQKITAKNSWSIPLIDHMSKLLSADSSDAVGADEMVGNENALPHHESAAMTNFARASVALDASVRIWACRVDDTYSSSFRVMENLSRSDGTAAPADAAEDDGQGGAEAASDKPRATQRRQRETQAATDPDSSVSLGSTTLETNASAVTLDHIEAAFEVDPLFHKLSSSFDEAGVSGMLLNRLHVHGGGLVAFDSSSLTDPDATVEAVAGRMQDAKTWKDLYSAATLPRLPLHSDHVTALRAAVGAPPCNPPALETLYQSMYQLCEALQRPLPKHDATFGTDSCTTLPGALPPAPFPTSSPKAAMNARTDAALVTDVAALPDWLPATDGFDSVPSNGAIDNGAGDVEYGGDYDYGAADDDSDDRSPVTSATEVAANLLRCDAVSAVDAEGSAMTVAWAQDASSPISGPVAGGRHWTFKNAAAAARRTARKRTAEEPTESGGPVTNKGRGRRARGRANAPKARGSTAAIDFGAVLPEGAFVPLAAKRVPAGRRARVGAIAEDTEQLSSRILGLTAGADASTFLRTAGEIDPIYGLQVVSSSGIIPARHQSQTYSAAAGVAADAGVHQQSLVEPDEDADYGPMVVDLGFGDDGDTDTAFPGDQAPGELPDGQCTGAPATMLAPTPDGVPTLVTAARHVEKIRVRYETVSKKVDVRALKQDMMAHLSSARLSTVAHAAVERDYAARAAHDASGRFADVSMGATGVESRLPTADTLSFQGLVKRIAREQPAAVTIPFYFITLLHLANENGLAFAPAAADGIDDFTILKSS